MQHQRYRERCSAGGAGDENRGHHLFEGCVLGTSNGDGAVQAGTTIVTIWAIAGVYDPGATR